MWFIGVEVEQETSVSPPKKYPGSARDLLSSPSEKRTSRSLSLDFCWPWVDHEMSRPLDTRLASRKTTTVSFSEGLGSDPKGRT